MADLDAELRAMYEEGPSAPAPTPTPTPAPIKKASSDDDLMAMYSGAAPARPKASPEVKRKFEPDVPGPRERAGFLPSAAATALGAGIPFGPGATLGEQYLEGRTSWFDPMTEGYTGEAGGIRDFLSPLVETAKELPRRSVGTAIGMAASIPLFEAAVATPLATSVAPGLMAYPSLAALAKASPAVSALIKSVGPATATSLIFGASEAFQQRPGGKETPGQTVGRYAKSIAGQGALNLPAFAIGARVKGGKGAKVEPPTPSAPSVPSGPSGTSVTPYLPEWARGASPEFARERMIGPQKRVEPAETYGSRATIPVEGVSDQPLETAVARKKRIAKEYQPTRFISGPSGVKDLDVPALPRSIEPKTTDGISPMAEETFSRASKEAETNLPKGVATIEDALNESGIDPALAERAAVNAAPVLKSSPLESTVRTAETVIDQNIRVGESIATQAGGKINRTYGPQPMSVWSRWSFPSTIARKWPQVADTVNVGSDMIRQYGRAARDFHGSIVKPLQKLPKDDRIQVGQTLHVEDSLGRRLTDDELLTRGIVGQKRAAYDISRKFLDWARKDMTSRGYEVLGDAYAPQVFVGDIGIFDLDVPGKGGKGNKLIFAVGSEKELMAKLNELFDKNPNAKYRIAPRVEIPDSIYALNPKGMKGLSDAAKSVYRDQVVTKNEFVGFKKRGKFFGNLERRTGNMANFETDVAKMIDAYGNGYIRKIHLDRFNKVAWDAMEKLDVGGNPQLKTWLENYIGHVNGRPSAIDEAIYQAFGKVGIGRRAVDKGLRNLSLFNLMSKIGVNPSSGFINFTQTILNTEPVLGFKYTKRGVVEGISVLRGEKTPRNVVNQAVVRELGLDVGAGYPGSFEGFAPAPEGKIQNGTLVLFNSAEKANRTIAGLGAYYKAIEEFKWSREKALGYARDTVRRTQFDLNITDEPEFFRSKAVKSVFQFKKYFLNELKFIGSLKKNEIVPFVRNWLLMTGTKALPIVSGLAIAKKFAVAHPNISAGVPGMLGVDVSGQVGMRELAGGSKDLGGIVGVGGQEAYDVGKFLYETGKEVSGGVGDVGGAAEKVRKDFSPVFFERTKRLYQELATGMARSSTTGNVIGKVSPAEAWSRWVGFTPVRLSKLFDVASLEKMKSEEATARRKRGISSFLRSGTIRQEDLRAFGSMSSFYREVKRVTKEKNLTMAERMIKRAPKRRRAEVAAELAE